MIKHRSELFQLLPEHFVVAELGVAEGRFSLQLLEMGAGKLYAVDNWETIAGQSGDGGHPNEWHKNNLFEFTQRVWKYRFKVVSLRGMTNEMYKKVPDGELDLLYVDANHTFPAVTEDLNLWYPKVKPGGIVAGHDVLNPSYGVSKAVNQFCQIHGYKITIIPEDHPSNASFYFIKK